MPQYPPNLSLFLATSETNTTMPAVSKYLVMIQAIGAFRVFGIPIMGLSFKRTVLNHEFFDPYCFEKAEYPKSC
jgi:hypothetical protein